MARKGSLERAVLTTAVVQRIMLSSFLWLDPLPQLIPPIAVVIVALHAGIQIGAGGGRMGERLSRS